MPIYEFYCADCHTVFSFLSRTPGGRNRPACPRCGRPDLERRASAFAISRGGGEDRGEADASPEVDEGRLERAMESLAGEIERMDDENPRQAARLMRKLYGAAGLPLSAGMEEAIRRMEAGEDPERIEAEMGDALDEDPLAGGVEETKKRLKRRLLPPAVDDHLYEM